MDLTKREGIEFFFFNEKDHSSQHVANAPINVNPVWGGGGVGGECGQGEEM